MGKPPATSRKQLRTRAPYQAKLSPAGARPLDGPPLDEPHAHRRRTNPHAPTPMAAGAEMVTVTATASSASRHTLVEAWPPTPAPLALGDLDVHALAASGRLICDVLPTSLPAPREIAAGDPTDPMVAPGPVPSGDSRSMRAGSQFALVYRHGATLVSRRGMVGQRGVWRVVDYPGPAQAAAAYAAECSRLRDQGFADLASCESTEAVKGLLHNLGDETGPQSPS